MATGTINTEDLYALADTWRLSRVGALKSTEFLREFCKSHKNHFVFGTETSRRWTLGLLGTNPCRLVVRFNTLSGNTTGVVQGGAIASIVDVSMLLAAICTNHGLGPTAWLNLEYRKPLLLHTPYVVDTTVVRKDGRKLYVIANVRESPQASIRVYSEGMFLVNTSKL